MIWFILALIVPLVLGILWHRFGMMGVDDWGEIFAVWGFGGFIGVFVALVVNAILAFVLPNQLVDTEHKIASRPTIINDETTGFAIQVNTTDGKTFSDSGLGTTLIDSTENVVIERDLVVYNGWLSMFNYGDNELIIKIPESQLVYLGQ